MRFIFITLFLLTSIIIYAQEMSKTRIIIFNQLGQKEKILSDEKISIIYGKNINTEYVYLNYIPGKRPEEYYIELKSIEPFLQDIASSDSSNDSLRNIIKNLQTKSLKSDSLSHNIKATPKKNDYEVIDSLIKVYKFKDAENVFDKMPKVKTLIEAVDDIGKQNNIQRNSNDNEMKKIDNQIDSLQNLIRRADKLGLNKNKIDEYLQEIASLKNRKNEIQLINNQLVQNNKILEKELIARNAEYDSLMRLIYIMILIIALIIVITLAIYYSYYQKKKYNRQLSEINRQLELTNNELYHSNVENENLLAIIKGELNLASKYVISLFPSELKDSNVETEWFYKSSEELGGDSFGYHYIDDENFAMYLIDVSGHGVGAALHSVQVLNILQNSALLNVDFRKPDEVMNALNSIFQMNHYGGLYFTIFYCVYNTINNTLTYSAAGHPPMLLLRDDDLLYLESQNIFIGAVPDINYTSDVININPKDILYIFSDGIYEIIDIEQRVWTYEDFIVRLTKERQNHNFSLCKFYEDNLKISGKKFLDDDFSFVKVSFKK